jgi:hypothetical protein
VATTELLCNRVEIAAMVAAADLVATEHTAFVVEQVSLLPIYPSRFDFAGVQATDWSSS